MIQHRIAKVSMGYIYAVLQCTHCASVRHAKGEMMANNVICGGFRSKRRKKEDHENKVLRCEVSERWIQLPVATDLTVSDIDYMRLDVMTNGGNDKPKKLCEIIVNRSELVRLLKDIPIIDHRGTEND